MVRMTSIPVSGSSSWGSAEYMSVSLSVHGTQYLETIVMLGWPEMLLT